MAEADVRDPELIGRMILHFKKLHPEMTLSECYDAMIEKPLPYYISKENGNGSLNGEGH